MKKKKGDYPRRGERVEVVCNETLEVIREGALSSLSREEMKVTVDVGGGFITVDTFDAQVHHFKGYKPKVLLVRNYNGSTKYKPRPKPEALDPPTSYDEMIAHKIAIAERELAGLNERKEYLRQEEENTINGILELNQLILDLYKKSGH